MLSIVRQAVVLWFLVSIIGLVGDNSNCCFEGELMGAELAGGSGDELLLK